MTDLDLTTQSLATAIVLVVVVMAKEWLAGHRGRVKEQRDTIEWQDRRIERLEAKIEQLESDRASRPEITDGGTE